MLLPFPSVDYSVVSHCRHTGESQSSVKRFDFSSAWSEDRDKQQYGRAGFVLFLSRSEEAIAEMM